MINDKNYNEFSDRIEKYLNENIFDQYNEPLKSNQ